MTESRTTNPSLEQGCSRLPASTAALVASTTEFRRQGLRQGGGKLSGNFRDRIHCPRNLATIRWKRAIGRADLAFTKLAAQPNDSYNLATLSKVEIPAGIRQGPRRLSRATRKLYRKTRKSRITLASRSARKASVVRRNGITKAIQIDTVTAALITIARYLRRKPRHIELALALSKAWPPVTQRTRSLKTVR